MSFGTELCASKNKKTVARGGQLLILIYLILCQDMG
jgi:hypothetical protein